MWTTRQVFLRSTATTTTRRLALSSLTRTYQRTSSSLCLVGSSISSSTCYGFDYPRRFLSAAPVADTMSSSAQPPFSKVLIANRGEICQRVMKTCQELGIKTVAIHSTADSRAPFVQMADEAICIGPADSSASYLNVPRVLRAIRDTGAQAVHPGYGFLSENANFCQSIENEGVAWLGPPVHAIHDMGDKIRSKEIAEAAGVTIIPGYDGTIESLDHAIEVSNNIGYPVLVKAAAGGGGKGMRTCYTDQDVREAYPLAKAEASKFFADDRLLIEKYIENPHHIEFQVLCSPPPGQKTPLDNPEDLQVVVFPERECSIQRRNQKVVEESPSCLLTEETRFKMVEQVKQLCQKVGYVSAGTVEWLVDEKQNFYFLEMNTRLQVEHPITEAVTGVDLVKGMLYVGAGWGLPSEFQIDGTLMPHKGHAIEARVYAEDPLRGYLPSTGPLIPYKEPAHAKSGPRKVQDGKSYIRLDSGVTEGHVVTPFYDPMLSKIISYAPTRGEAIDTLANGLDEYVIEGVQHNARLVNAVLRHPSFRAGDTPTSFLPRHIPKFIGVQLSDPEEEELAVAVAFIAKARQEYLQKPPIVNWSSSPSVVVRLGGMFGDKAFSVTTMMNDDNGSTATRRVTVQRLTSTDGEDSKVVSGGSMGRVVRVDKALQYDPEHCLARISLDGDDRAIQVIKEDLEGEIKVQMYGADMYCLVQSPKEYELSKYMHPPVVADTSDLVMSPMPGTLISFSVREGDHVEEGQELCIVEAMKMQNIVRAPREGFINKFNVQQGQAMVTDQVIMEYATDMIAKAMVDT